MGSFIAMAKLRAMESFAEEEAAAERGAVDATRFVGRTVDHVETTERPASCETATTSKDRVS